MNTTENNIEECLYKYGDSYYTLTGIYDIYKNKSFNYKKEIKDCICDYILAEILKKGGMAKESKILDELTTYKAEHIGKTMTKAEKFVYEKVITLKGIKLLGLAARKYGYKLSEIMNGEWILKKLIILTLGSNVPINQIDDFTLIDYSSLSEDECAAIAKNFMNNIWDVELEQYRGIKTYSKKNTK